MKRLLVILTLSLFIVRAQEYLYPVGCGYNSDGTAVMYLLYQRSLEHVELLAWNPVNGTAHKALLSTYIPAFFTLLPDNSGFSFIDKGRIRVKHFNKRSPQTIALYAPIDTITSVEWIDAESCYFSARLGNRFAIFHTDLDGTMTQIMHHHAYDFLYPQYKAGTLFSIRRSPQGTYAIGMQAQGSTDYTAIVDFEETPLAFLHMIDSTNGYVIQHQPYLDRHDLFASFACWHISATAQGWVKKQLFQFTIPTDLFYGDTTDRFYESIVPLLPRYSNQKLYFVSYNDAAHALTLYQYSLTHQTVTSLYVLPPLYVCCAPCELYGLLFYGGTVVDITSQLQWQFPSMTLDDDYVLRVNVPYVMPTEQ